MNIMRDPGETDRMYEVRRREIENIQAGVPTTGQAEMIKKEVIVELAGLATKTTAGDIVARSDNQWARWREDN